MYSFVIHKTKQFNFDSMSIFNPDFYPTPESVLDTMMVGEEIKGKVILDPSAGSGNILKYAKIGGAKEALFCEIENDLATISSRHGRMIGKDFLELKKEDISHIDYIIANPPFSKDDQHILHMWDIAPDGCTVITLMNWNTYDLTHTNSRRRLKTIILTNGNITHIGNVFSTAERKTDVAVGLVKLYKPKGSGDDEFDGYFDLNEDEEHQEDALMGYNDIRNIVNRYVGAVKMFDEVMEANTQINDLIKPISTHLGITFGAHSQNNYSVSRDTFKKELQKSSWKTVFNKMEMGKYTTEKVMSQLNNFVEKQSHVPFTMTNIHKMVEMIVGTHKGRMDGVLIEIFDWLTERHKTNRKNLEGWKTNSMYFVDTKFIAPYAGITMGIGGHPEVRWSTSGEKMDEFTKALCVLTGKNYDNFETLHSFFQRKEVSNDKEKEAIKMLSEELSMPESKAKAVHFFSKHAATTSNKNYYRAFWDLRENAPSTDEIDRYKAFYEGKRFSSDCWGKQYEVKEWGKWHDWGFFEIKVYKKGTLHGRFKDEKVWEMFNVACSKAKGWALPTNTGSDVRRKEKGVEIYKNN